MQICGDPCSFFAHKRAGKSRRLFFSPDHDWNTDQFAWIVFVPMLLMKMVVYETLFDLCFYWQHRLFHTVPWLYRVHKHHHTLTDPQKTNRDPLLKSWHTFHMSFLEVMLTLGLHIPCMALLKGVCGSHPFLRLTGLDIALIHGYMTVGEITGHVDGAFASCHWIPANLIVNGVLGLTPFAEKEHNLHHTILVCNYSKRIGVWDMLFGSFVSAEGSAGNWHPKKKKKM